MKKSGDFLINFFFFLVLTSESMQNDFIFEFLIYNLVLWRNKIASKNKAGPFWGPQSL